jgi:hypothetical protein
VEDTDIHTPAPGVRLLAFPFRLSPSGHVVTHADGSDECYMAELADLMLTHPGERVMVPEYGVVDPTFGKFDIQELRIKVEMFGPPVSVDTLDTEWETSSKQRVRVGFSTERVI